MSLISKPCQVNITPSELNIILDRIKQYSSVFCTPYLTISLVITLTIFDVGGLRISFLGTLINYCTILNSHALEDLSLCRNVSENCPFYVDFFQNLDFFGFDCGDYLFVMNLSVSISNN